LVEKVSKETFIRFAPVNALLSGATAYKILGAAHPLRALLTSFLKEVSKTRHILHLILY